MGGLTTIQASVTISIQDINDNPPVFTQPNFTVDVAEKIMPGSEFFNITATDADQVYAHRESIEQPMVQ